MGIRIQKVNIVYESVTMSPIEPDIVFPDKMEVIEYLKKKPFPETSNYTREDLIFDTQTTGVWTIPNDLSKEQENYIKEMVDYFLKKR